jgi:hypothetical protein
MEERLIMLTEKFGRVFYSALVLSAGISRAQSFEPRDAWLMKNYRFTGPPPGTELRQHDPVVSKLQEIQDTVMAILRKANFENDYEAALAAAAQAIANAQLIGVITDRVQSAKTLPTDSADLKTEASLYIIAFKDGTIAAATAYWWDGLMLHYLTRQGAHTQVRLDLVDRHVSTELNRLRKLEMHLPE